MANSNQASQSASAEDAMALYRNLQYDPAVVDKTMKSFLHFLCSQGYAIDKKQGDQWQAVAGDGKVDALVDRFLSGYQTEPLGIFFVVAGNCTKRDKSHIVLAPDSQTAKYTIPVCRTKVKKRATIGEMPIAQLKMAVTLDAQERQRLARKNNWCLSCMVIMVIILRSVEDEKADKSASWLASCFRRKQHPPLSINA